MNTNSNIMYHINPAVTKSILRSMPRKEIPAEMEKLKQKIIETEPGTERSKFVSIYRFCEKLIS
ncbi:hypothetical protein [Brumimicrobium aurantiacum]|uniref:Uncharacterized protein n=1 Tax=Brumimicrobium aurantiacum TaxID=1737063 RepID=A0A3E1EWV8_9FLAO|nr:hypothetical protein [Brumimicrobium aurantiacum]RFC54045.1 hypothetical protein DXU93_10930 [Brumimicrobium aurantiacum]